MTREEVLYELGIQNVELATQEAILQNIVMTVEYRFSNIIDDLLSEEQAVELGALETIEAVIEWLRGNVPSSVELYNSILKDHIAELKEQLDRP